MIFFFIIIIFRHVGWSDRHILQNEITCYISLMSLSSSFLCYWLCHISLWDFINFCIIILSWQGAFLLWFVEKFCEWSDPHLTDGDLWLSKVARWSVRLLVCGGAGPLVFWLGLFQTHHSLCFAGFCCTDAPELWLRSFDFCYSSRFDLGLDSYVNWIHFFVPAWRCWNSHIVKWKSLSRVQLFATPWTIQSMEFSRPVYWSGVAFPFSRGSSQPRYQTQVSHVAGGFFTSWATTMKAGL